MGKKRRRGSQPGGIDCQKSDGLHEKFDDVKQAADRVLALSQSGQNELEKVKAKAARLERERDQAVASFQSEQAKFEKLKSYALNMKEQLELLRSKAPHEILQAPLQAVEVLDAAIKYALWSFRIDLYSFADAQNVATPREKSLYLLVDKWTQAILQVNTCSATSKTDLHNSVSKCIFETSTAFAECKVARFALTSLLALLDAGAFSGVWQTVERKCLDALYNNELRGKEEFAACMIYRKQNVCFWLLFACRALQALDQRILQACCTHTWKLPKDHANMILNQTFLAAIRVLVKDHATAGEQQTSLLERAFVHFNASLGLQLTEKHLQKSIERYLSQGTSLNKETVSELFVTCRLVAECLGWDWTFRCMISKILWPAIALPGPRGDNLSFRLLLHLAKHAVFRPPPDISDWHAIAQKLESRLLSQVHQEQLTEHDKITHDWGKKCLQQIQATIIKCKLKNNEL